ncbi:polyprenol monophosphomannose synthase [Microbacteriaceae bacterium VKM Ac-2854]|nr:polyprenol monophosphomannose synthase [Microbacteriaceae bacterium VKM Ac-2854]
MPHLAIVIPTYDEAANIEPLLRRIEQATASMTGVRVGVVVVDDSSPDGTAESARAVAVELERVDFTVRVWVRKEKNGLGAAYIWAISRLLAEEDAPDLILQMDADFSHDPKYIPALVAETQAGADFVVASRYIPGGGTPDWSLDRKILSRGGNLYTRLILGRKLTDYTGGFNLFTADLLHRVHFETVTSSGYGFQIELKYRALRAARRIREVPIVFLDRAEGESKIPGDTLWRNLLLVLEIRFGKHR